MAILYLYTLSRKYICFHRKDRIIFRHNTQGIFSNRFSEANASAAVTVSARRSVNGASAATSAARNASAVVSIILLDFVHRYMTVDQRIPAVSDVYAFQIRIALWFCISAAEIQKWKEGMHNGVKDENGAIAGKISDTTAGIYLRCCRAADSELNKNTLIVQNPGY